MSMTEFITPSLLIADYYDGLIRDIDIYTEKLLAKFGNWSLLEKEPESLEKEKQQEAFPKCQDKPPTDPYRFEYNCDKYLEQERLEVQSDETNVVDYLNRVRARAIDGIRKAQEHNLELYESNKESYKIDRDYVNEEYLEQLRCRLFGDKFCFQLEINTLGGHLNKCLFKLYTVITDFYLSKHDIDFLRANLENKWQRTFEINFEKKYGIKVIDVNKKSLLAIDKLEIDCSSNSRQFVPDGDGSTLDFSSLKSLNVKYDLRNVYCPNLEYLKICNSKLNLFPFGDLNNLLQLSLINCDFSNFDISCIGNFTRLVLLKIEKLGHSIDFSKLTELKWLLLSNLDNVGCIQSVGECLTALEITLTKFYSNTDVFLTRCKLPNLTWLNLENNFINSFDKNWFLACPNLKYLSLKSCCVYDINFLGFGYLDKLEHLDLSNNRLFMIGANNFSHMSTLRVLKLNNNHLQKLDPHVFKGLRSLQVLNLNESCLSGKLSKNTFEGLANLIELYLSKNCLSGINPDAFAQTPNLEKLDLSSNKFNLQQSNCFSHLNHLKWISLKNNKNMSENILESLKNSNVEIA